VVLLSALPAHLAAQLQSNVPLLMNLSWFVSNSSEALIGASLTLAIVARPLRFRALREMVSYLLCCGLLGPFLASFLDAGLVKLNGWGNGAYWEIWRIRFFSGALAAVVLAPALVIWLGEDHDAIRGAIVRNWLEAGVLGLGLVLVSFVVFIRMSAGVGSDPALLYGSLPFLLWAAVRFGPAGASITVLLTSFIAIWGAANGHGPFSAQLPEANALALQMFFIVSGGLLLLLATLISERETTREVFVKAFRSNPDAMAIGVLRAARELGVDVPGDMSVVGFDDIDISQHTNPPLTTVHQPMRLLGEHACTRLLDRITAPDIRQKVEVLPTELVLRSSCGCPPGTMIRQPLPRLRGRGPAPREAAPAPLPRLNLTAARRG
jgi:integral membrane sensor domain MASE1